MNRCHSVRSHCCWSPLHSHHFGCSSCANSFPTHVRRPVQCACSIALLFRQFQSRISDRTLWHHYCSPVHVCKCTIRHRISKCWTIRNYIERSKTEFNLQEYAIEIAILFDVIKYVFDHDRANAQPTIRIQAAKCHDVQAPLVLRCVQATANRTNHNIIVVGELC